MNLIWGTGIIAFKCWNRFGGIRGQSDMSEEIRQEDVFDEEGFIAHESGNVEFARELAGEMLRCGEAYFMEIQDAVLRIDAGSIHKRAHKLKGALRTLHATRSTRAAQDVEIAGKSCDISQIDELVATLRLELNRFNEALKAFISTGDE